MFNCVNLAKIQSRHSIQLLVPRIWCHLQRILGHPRLVLACNRPGAFHVNDSVILWVDPWFGDTLPAICTDRPTKSEFICSILACILYLQAPGALRELCHDNHTPNGTVDGLPIPSRREGPSVSNNSAISPDILVPKDGEDLPTCQTVLVKPVILPYLPRCEECLRIRLLFITWPLVRAPQR